MVGTWKDAAAGSCLASACDDTGNSATLINGSTAYVDMCILGAKKICPCCYKNFLVRGEENYYYYDFANWCDCQPTIMWSLTQDCLLLLVSTRLGHWGKAETVEADGSQTWVPSVLALILSAVLQVWSSFSLFTEKLSFEAFIWPTMNCSMLYMSKLPKTDHFAFGHMNAHRIFSHDCWIALIFFQEVGQNLTYLHKGSRGLWRILSVTVRDSLSKIHRVALVLRPWVAQTKFRVGHRRVVKTVTQGSQWFVMAACLPWTVVLLGLVSFFGQDCMSGTCCVEYFLSWRKGCCDRHWLDNAKLTIGVIE